MRRIRWVVLGLLVALTVAAAIRSARVNGTETRIVREPAIAPAAEGAAAAVRPAPEFPHADPAAWINSAPLRMSALRGKVVLLDVWTFG
jgi:hypothetical protein